MPKSCPTPYYAYESNSMLMKYRVYGRLLNFIKHIHSHDDSNLSKQILNQQMMNEWPCLSKIALQLCNDLNVSGLFNSQMSKTQFKSVVKRACRTKSDEELADRIKSYKKMSAIRDEIEKGNSYFFKESLQNARSLFPFRVDMYESKLNFKHKPEYNFLCKNDLCRVNI